MAAEAAAMIARVDLDIVLGDGGVRKWEEMKGVRSGKDDLTNSWRPRGRVKAESHVANTRSSRWSAAGQSLGFQVIHG